ncbi:MAG: hypothetical protein ACLR7U_14700, partial [Ruthenibacterium lactatiformans]
HKFTAGGPHFCGLSIAFSAPQALLLFCLFWCCSIAFFALSTVKRQEEGKKCSGLPKYDNNILCINAKVGFWKNLFSRLPALALFGEKQRPSMLFSNSAAQLCRLGAI